MVVSFVCFEWKDYLETIDQRDPPILGNTKKCWVSGFSSYLLTGLEQILQAVFGMIDQTQYQVIWVPAVSWFSPTDFTLSFSSSVSWEHEVFSGKLPWPGYDAKSCCQLNFEFIYGAELLLIRMPCLVSLLFPLFTSALSFTALQRALWQKGNTWTMQSEAKSFLSLS